MHTSLKPTITLYLKIKAKFNTSNVYLQLVSVQKQIAQHQVLNIVLEAEFKPTLV